MTDFSKTGLITNISASVYDRLKAGEQVSMIVSRPLMGKNIGNGLAAYVQLFPDDIFSVESVRQGGSSEVRPKEMRVMVVNFRSEQKGFGIKHIHRKWVYLLQKA
jgi:hypothetical protein